MKDWTLLRTQSVAAGDEDMKSLALVNKRVRLFRALALSALVVAILVPGCSAPVHEVSYLVVMSAFSPELTGLLEKADVEEVCVLDQDTLYVGSLAGVDVVLLLSGIGLEQAAQKTQAVLNRFDVSGIVFSGIAGGVNPDLKIGDVTVPAKWAWADGEEPSGGAFWLPVDSTMLRVASEVAESVTLKNCTPDGIFLAQEPVIVIGGNGVSNSFFVDDAVYREWLWETFAANAVDMETAAVARVAHKHDVPYIAFRSLSDLAGGGPGANEVDIFFQLAADNAAAVVAAFLERWAASGLSKRLPRRSG